MSPPKFPSLHRWLIGAAVAVVALAIHARSEEKEPNAPIVTIQPMSPGTHLGPFQESEITEIFDEGLNRVVYSSEK